MLEDTPDDPDIPYLIAGNYSELVTEQVEYILDHNPELEAIAFANDNMAKAGYRVCAARDLLVGHDIAITGFDDIDHAKTMEPPLTSVSHSSFQFSYQHYRMRLCSVRERSYNPAGCQPFFTREAPAVAGCTPALPHCVISAWNGCVNACQRMPLLQDWAVTNLFPLF